MVPTRNLCNPLLLIAICLMVLTAGNAVAVDSDGDLFDDAYEENMRTDPVDPNSYPSLPITGFVQHVVEADETSRTYFEVTIGEGFLGALPGPITIEITRTDADGNISVIALPAYEYLSEWRDFFWDLPGEPDLGVYTFNVTYGIYSGSDVDYQYTIRYLPEPSAGSFAPADGQTITSSTPSFSWDAIDYTPPAGEPNPPIYYRLEVSTAPGSGRVFASSYVYDMTSYTLPAGVLTAGETYYWRVRFMDGAGWPNYMNRRNGQWRAFTMANTLTHGAVPAIDGDGWGIVSYNRPPPEGIGTEIWVKIYDHDGVASDGSSHTVTVKLPGDPAEYPVSFFRSEGNYSAGYEFWDGGNPPAPGEYVFKVVDPDGRTGTYKETVTALDLDALPPVDENTIEPSVQDEHIRVKYDNIYINYINNLPAVYENFDSYATIEELDSSIWIPVQWWQNATIGRDNGDGWLILDIGNSVGRANGNLDFANPESITSIKADVSIEENSGSNTRAQLRGAWCHNGVGDVFGKLSIIGDRIYYQVTQEYINEHGTYQWDTLADEEVYTGYGLGDTVTLGIEWMANSSTLRFTVGGNYYDFTVAGALGPPQLDNSKQLRTRIDLVFGDTTPTFSWAEVPGANRYRIRIFNYDDNNRLEVWRKTFGATGTGKVSITTPPAVLRPNSYYRFRIEAWDSHSPLDVNSISRIPVYSSEYYQFYTGETETQKPFITLENSGVRTVSSEFYGTRLTFWIEVHDAQGVPGDIQSVTVTHPDGTKEPLIYWGDNPYNPSTETSANYYGDSLITPMDGGTYTFTVTDKENNTFSVEEVLIVEPVASIPATSMMPADNATIGNTAVSFDWADADGAAYYSLYIFDYDFNLIYVFHPTESFYNLPAGFLETGKLYRWRILSRREYFDQNVDNMSSVPFSTWDSLVFATTPPADTEGGGGDGMPDYWELLHGLDPTVNDADFDLDYDGLNNAGEFQRATDPQNKDTDNDGVLDGEDAFPLSADESFDTDGDGVGDNTDNCLNVSNPDQTDTDGDGKGDVCDYDICPAGFDTQPSYTGDCQNRPPGTVCAVFADAYVWLISESVTGWNTQGDLESAYGTSHEHQHLLGSNCIKMIALDADRDGDGVSDDLEDNCLDFFNPRTNWVDINGDAHVDAQADFDLDEIGDPCDPDDDNDGVVDAEDNCPFAFNQKVNGLQPDLDGDGIGNACDQDADGDGYVFFIYFDPAVHLNGYDCDDSNPDPAYINGDCLGSAAPKKKNTIQDRDGDGITDDQDSCPDDPNIGDSDGDGIDGACDGCDIAGADPDGDNICTANDNCPDVYNPSQLPSDCPPPIVDADGDGFSPPEDCNDDDQKIYPGAPEIIDGVDNDCNNAIDDTNAYFVHFEMTGYDDWLPGDGNTAVVTVSVRSATPNGPTVTPSPPGFTVTTVPGSQTAMTGKYTNDPSGLSGADITYTLAGNQLEFTSHDYGGRITVRAEAKVTVGGVVYPVFGEFTLPKDADKDGLPDKWEMDVTNSLSVLTSAGGDSDGDGLSNGKEFRGFMWGPEMTKITGNSSGTYQTDAWVPSGDAKHFRTDPRNFKDLFVKVTGYDFNSGNDNNGFEAPCDCPFALGDAYNDAGVAVHVLSMDNPPGFMGTSAGADDIVKWEGPIDVVTITNYQTGTFSTSDGDINKIGIRDWNWDIKGFSGIGNETLYGGGTRTYQVPLDNIFTQEPYIDGSEHTGNDLGGNPVFLDRIDGASVEDKNDNGLDDYNKKAKQYEAEVFQDLDVLGGDVLAQPISFDHSHSAFDVDGDGRVEIPLINDPSKPYSGDYIYEYTKAQMLKGTLSHELGHAIGMSHTTVPTCLMFEYTNNYHRDNFFSDSARAAMRIHNIEEQP